MINRVKKMMINLLMMIKHQVSAQAARLVENVRGSVQIMMGVASQKLDGANETVMKGSQKELPKHVQAEMIQPRKFVLVVSIVTLVRKSVLIMRDVAGNQQQNVRPTVERSGVVVNALVVQIVDHVRVNVRITMGVASLKLDTVSVTVGKGSPKEPPKDVQAVMIQPQKFVLVVTLVVHASESVRQMRVVAGNQQVHARAIVNRNGFHVKPYFFHSWFL